MASVSAYCLRSQPSFLGSNKTVQRNGLNPLSVSWGKKNSSKAYCLRVSCAAKTETVQKVCDIVRKQLALNPEVQLTPETKFSDLGADSLDNVEIVMSIEEEFDVAVEEENNQNITTVQEAADMVEKLVEKKAESAPS